MKLDTDMFPINRIELGEKKILVHSTQTSTTKGKNVIVSDEIRSRMVKPHNPEEEVWKENYAKRPVRRVKPTSSMLIEKYMRQQQWGMARQLSGSKRHRSLGYQPCYGRHDMHCAPAVPWVSWAGWHEGDWDLQRNQGRLVGRTKFHGNRSIREQDRT
jgi:hypothetical protein